MLMLFHNYLLLYPDIIGTGLMISNKHVHPVAKMVQIMNQQDLRINYVTVDGSCFKL